MSIPTHQQKCTVQLWAEDFTDESLVNTKLRPVYQDPAYPTKQRTCEEFKDMLHKLQNKIPTQNSKIPNFSAVTFNKTGKIFFTGTYKEFECMTNAMIYESTRETTGEDLQQIITKCYKNTLH